MPLLEVNLTIENKLGLHARPAMAFVDKASSFSCKIDVIKGEQTVDGKSIMQLMMLAATKGTVLTVRADGDDAESAIESLKYLVESKFDEE